MQVSDQEPRRRRTEHASKYTHILPLHLVYRDTELTPLLTLSVNQNFMDDIANNLPYKKNVSNSDELHESPFSTNAKMESMGKCSMSSVLSS